MSKHKNAGKKPPTNDGRGTKVTAPKFEPVKKAKRARHEDGPDELKQLMSLDADVVDEKPVKTKTPTKKDDPDMSSKNVWDAPRASAPHKFDPHKLVIRGIDTEDGPADVLVDVTARHNKPSIEKLALNLLAVGQIHPVSIAKDGSKAVVTAGRRRVLAFRMINEWVKTKDPRCGGLNEQLMVVCTTQRGSEADLMFLFVSENEHAVADTPMSKARKANRLLALGKTEAEVAIAFGVTRQAIDNWKKLVDLHQDVQTAVDKGIIPASAAIELSALPREEQAAKFAELSKNVVVVVEQAGTPEPLNGEAPKRNGRITAQRVRAAARGEESTRPGLRAIRKVIEAAKADELDLSEVEPMSLLRWFAGELPTSKFKGFSKVINS
jgi:hypothetical protein